MTIVENKGMTTCKAWVNENPTFACPVLAAAPVDSKLAVSLELLIRSGPRFHYGLLGASWLAAEPSAAGLQIEIPYLTRGERTHGTLVDRIDIPRLGVPPQWGEPIRTAMRDEAAKLGFVIGILRVDHAVAGEIGSTLPLFRELAIAVTRIIEVGRDRRMEELEEVVRSAMPIDNASLTRIRA